MVSPGFVSPEFGLISAIADLSTAKRVRAKLENQLRNLQYYFILMVTNCNLL